MNDAEIVVEFPKSVTLGVPDRSLILRAESLRGVTECPVDTPDVYALVAEDRRSARAIHANLEEQRVFMKEPALETCRRIDEWFRAPKQYCTDFIAACDRGLIQFETIERAKQEAAEREAAREADERRRALDAEAAKHRDHGNEFVASQIEAVAKTVATPVAVPSNVPKVAGLSTRQLWQTNVTDKAAAVAWLMANNFAHCIDINEGKLTALGRSSEGQMQIPGVEFKQVASKSQRR